MWRFLSGLFGLTVLATPCLAASPVCTQPLTGRWTIGGSPVPFEKFISSTDDEIHGLLGRTAEFSSKEIRVGRFRCLQPNGSDEIIEANGKGTGLFTGNKQYILRSFFCKKGTTFDFIIGENCNIIHAFAGQKEAFELVRVPAIKP